MVSQPCSEVKLCFIINKYPSTFVASFSIFSCRFFGFFIEWYYGWFHLICSCSRHVGIQCKDLEFCSPCDLQQHVLAGFHESANLFQTLTQTDHFMKNGIQVVCAWSLQLWSSVTCNFSYSIVFCSNVTMVVQSSSWIMFVSLDMKISVHDRKSEIKVHYTVGLLHLSSYSTGSPWPPSEEPTTELYEQFSIIEISEAYIPKA